MNAVTKLHIFSVRRNIRTHAFLYCIYQNLLNVDMNVFLEWEKTSDEGGLSQCKIHCKNVCKVFVILCVYKCVLVVFIYYTIPNLVMCQSIYLIFPENFVLLTSIILPYPHHNICLYTSRNEHIGNILLHHFLIYLKHYLPMMHTHLKLLDWFRMWMYNECLLFWGCILE